MDLRYWKNNLKKAIKGRSSSGIGRLLMSASGCFRMKWHYNKEKSRNEMQLFEYTTTWSYQIQGLGNELEVSRYSYYAKTSFPKSAIYNLYYV